MKKHEHEKLWYEVRARKIIELFFNDSYTLPLKNSDKPDIIDTNGVIGIEVTRAFYENSAETIGLFSKYKNININDVPFGVKKRLDFLEAVFLYDDNSIFYGVVPKQNLTTIDVMLDEYHKKMKKYNNENYSTSKCDLYIYSPSFIEYNKEHIELLNKRIFTCEKRYTKRFHFIYVDDFNSIYRFNPNQKGWVTVVNISDNKNHIVNQEILEELETAKK